LAADGCASSSRDPAYCFCAVWTPGGPRGVEVAISGHAGTRTGAGAITKAAYLIRKLHEMPLPGGNHRVHSLTREACPAAMAAPRPCDHQDAPRRRQAPTGTGAAHAPACARLSARVWPAIFQPVGKITGRGRDLGSRAA
jgi:hypothetical protein